MASMAAKEHSVKSSQLENENTILEMKENNTQISESNCSQENDPDVQNEANVKKAAAKSVVDIKDVVEVTSCDNTQHENKKKLSVGEKKDQQNDHNAGRVKDVQNLEELTSISNKKDTDLKTGNSENVKETPVPGGNILKRTRRTIIQETESSTDDSNHKVKKKKIKNSTDSFCWRCHKESADVSCTACPRSWHRKCIGGVQPSTIQNWICGECAAILKAENAETRSTAMSELSVDQLCLLLKHVVERMRDYPGSEPFWKPVDTSEVPNYLDYVVKPMDLGLLEANVQAKLYGSTDAFMADAKWIQHNCIVFNTCGGVYTDTSKLTNAAKQIIKVARQEVSEIEGCPDCFAHGRNLPRPHPSWFIEPCRRPHPLVWAKLKGFPFWPAKAMPRVNSQGFVDVRFFGEHDRAWVSPRDLYLYSEDPPVPLPRKRKLDMDECVREITRHCRKLELAFGQFKFAPPRVQYNPNDPSQIKLMLPKYDPLHPNNDISSPFVTPKKKATPKKRMPSIRLKPQSDLHKVADKISTSVSSTNDKNKAENKIESKGIKRKSEVHDGIETTSNVDKVTVVKSKKTEVPPKSLEVKDVKLQLSKNASIQNTNVTENNVSGENIVALKENNSSEESINEVKLLESTSKHTINSKQRLLKNDQTHRKESLLERDIIKVDPLQNVSHVQKTSSKLTKNVVKVYKPKTRMVDKVNAERALKSISLSEQNKELDTSEMEHKSKPIENESSATNDTVKKADNSTSTSLLVSTPSPMPAKCVPDQSVALLLLVNSGITDSENIKQPTPFAEKEKNGDVSLIVQQIPKDTLQPIHQKKESKARKSFPNKPRTYLQAMVHPSSNTLPNAIESTIYSPLQQNENCTGYQFLPPEAGPVSACLYNGAQELAKRMAQLMESAYKEAAEENHQATIYFLRLQIERMRWQHQQQLAELKHNTDRIIREMGASMEAERIRAIEETRREAEEEKLRCIEKIKRKQWCAACGREALFYCCWNTAYCDYPCQQSHWPTHMRTCAQQPSLDSIVTNSAANSNQQQNLNAKVNNPAGRVSALSHNKLSEISASPYLSRSINAKNQESS